MLFHYNAMKAWLEGEPALTGKVHAAALVSSTGVIVRDTYVILFGGPPDSLESGRLAAPQRIDSDAEYLYPARCVSTTPSGALAVAAKVLGRAVGAVLTVPGRVCQPIRLDDSGPVTPDDNITPPLYYVDVDLLLASSPA